MPDSIAPEDSISCINESRRNFQPRREEPFASIQDWSKYKIPPRDEQNKYPESSIYSRTPSDVSPRPSESPKSHHRSNLIGASDQQSQYTAPRSQGGSRARGASDITEWPILQPSQWEAKNAGESMQNKRTHSNKRRKSSTNQKISFFSNFSNKFAKWVSGAEPTPKSAKKHRRGSWSGLGVNRNGTVTTAGPYRAQSEGKSRPATSRNIKHVPSPLRTTPRSVASSNVDGAQAHREAASEHGSSWSAASSTGTKKGNRDLYTASDGTVFNEAISRGLINPPRK
ncbi:hypothetical protein B0O99DRAFT_689921 [Bisporella sp. PMI_857]|nr:hypothetical protein B0O99DRAFT_689921 [Bisporella sp. PMI_857]